MEKEVKIKAIYRHFKGNYYYVENIAKSSENEDYYVIYRALYEPEKLYVRPLNMFLDKIDFDREDNVTKQKNRFEIVKETQKKI